MEKYYALLNVNSGADLNEIKKAYRRAVHLYHPDANGGVGDPEKFKEVVKAYNHLTKHHKSLGIKPVQAKRKATTSIFDRIGSFFADKPAAPPSYARTATAPKRKRTSRKDEFANLDPVMLKLPFEEIKFRFEESQNDYVRRESARALTFLFGAGALPLLKKELPSASVPVAEEIILCLGLIGDRESILILEKYVRHADVKIACAAVRALQDISQGLATVLLEKIAAEGRALKHTMLGLFDTLKARKLVQEGILERAEADIARFLHIHTRQPLPVILRELGFTVSE